MRDLSDRELERAFELDGAPGPARPVDDTRARAIVARALDATGFAPPGGSGSGGSGGGGSSSSGGGSGGGGGGPVHASAKHGAASPGSAVKLAVLAGGAAIAIATVAWLALRAPRQPAAMVAPPAPAAPASSSPSAVAPPAVAASSSPPAVAPIVPPVARAPEPIEPQPETPEPGPATTPARPTPGKHTKPVRSHSQRHASRAEPRVAAAEPDDLLAEANAARVAHHWRDADTLYGKVVAGGQGALAVQAALVASASLRLEHLGDPAGAARRFRAALAAGPRDPLAEDARWGLVEAARAVADTAGELRALDDFLAHHAGSARAARARARREELGAPP